MLESWRGERMVADHRCWERKQMARRGPIPRAQTTQRPNRRRLWIMLGVLGGIVYVALQARSGAALFYPSNPALFQNKAPVAPSGWHIATPPGQATNSSSAVSLVAETRQPRSWLDFFGGNARNLTTSQLLWTPAT
jgi:hypothetical protein